MIGTAKRNRGSLILELVVAAAVVAIVVTGATSLFTQTFRLRLQSEIATGNVNAAAAEVKRLRSLPLSAFYEVDATTPRSRLTYYRKLSLPGSSYSSKLYARIDLALTAPSGAGGPIQVFLTCRPVYVNGNVTASATPGVGTSSASILDTVPNGIPLRPMVEAQTFIVL